jgi:predicted transcriptional regulator
MPGNKVSKAVKTQNLKHSKSACLLKSAEMHSNFTYFAVTFQQHFLLTTVQSHFSLAYVISIL